MKDYEAGRELDELIAVRVMGFVCIHKVERVPNEVVAEAVARAWKEEYGVDCPPGYALSTAIYDQEESDYPDKWCAKCHAPMNSGLFGWSVPKYSTDISAAWQVVEKMSLWICPADDGHSWTAGKLAQGEPSPDGGEWADTAPLAICRAAIKALEK